MNLGIYLLKLICVLLVSLMEDCFGACCECMVLTNIAYCFQQGYSNVWNIFCPVQQNYIIIVLELITSTLISRIEAFLLGN